jgi:uncharacterized protein YoxC
MTFTDFAMIVIAASTVIFVLTLIPTLLAIKKTAISAGMLTDMMQQELKPTLQELTAVLTELKTVSKHIAEKTDDLNCFMSALGETGTNLHTINRAIGTVSSALNVANTWATGVKVAGKYMLQRYLINRGGK